jgi:hypothetical protein
MEIVPHSALFDGRGWLRIERNEGRGVDRLIGSNYCSVGRDSDHKQAGLARAFDAARQGCFSEGKGGGHDRGLSPLLGFHPEPYRTNDFRILRSHVPIGLLFDPRLLLLWQAGQNFYSIALP